jgi:hypothetical protein
LTAQSSKFNKQADNFFLLEMSQASSGTKALFKKSTNPAVTYTKLSIEIPVSPHEAPINENAPLGIYQNLKKVENSVKPVQSKITKENVHKYISVKQSTKQNSSNVSSDIANDLSIKELHNNDNMNERFPSDFLYLDVELLDNKRSDYSSASENKNYVGENILPPNLLGPYDYSLNFGPSPGRSPVMQYFDPSTPLANVKKALFKHFYLDKPATAGNSYRSYIYPDKSDHLSEIHMDGKDANDSSLINFVTYLDENDLENIPSTPREFNNPIEIKDTLEPKKAYFVTDSNQVELSCFLTAESSDTPRPENMCRISNIQSDFKYDSTGTSMYTSSILNTRSNSKKSSLKNTPGRISDFSASGSPVLKNRQNKLEEVAEMAREYDSQEPKKSKVKAKFKMNPADLSRLVGKDLSISSKGNSMFFGDEKSKDYCQTEATPYESNILKNNMNRVSLEDFKAHTRCNSQPQESLKGLKHYMSSTSSKGQVNESNLFTTHPGILGTNSHQSFNERYHKMISDNSMDGYFKDQNSELEDLICTLRLLMLEFKNCLDNARVDPDNSDLTFEYIEIALLRGEEILFNNSSIAKLQIDCCGIGSTLDYFKTLSKAQIYKDIRSTLNTLFKVAKEKESNLEKIKLSSKQSSAASRKENMREKAKIPKLDLNKIFNNMKVQQVKTDQKESDCRSMGWISDKSPIHPIVNSTMQQWIEKKSTVPDFDRIKTKFTSYVLLCKDELPSNHPGKKVLVTALFEEMIMKNIEETNWLDFIQENLNNPPKILNLSDSKSSFACLSLSNRNCYF